MFENTNTNTNTNTWNRPASVKARPSHGAVTITGPQSHQPWAWTPTHCWSKNFFSEQKRPRCTFHRINHLFWPMDHGQWVMVFKRLRVQCCITDVEFVTNGICAKYFWALVELSRINAKNYPLCEICRIQVRVSQKNGVSFYLSK